MNKNNLGIVIICSIITVLVPFSNATLLGKILVIIMPWGFSLGMIYFINRLDKKPNIGDVKRE